jgi:hypothetical protein
MQAKNANILLDLIGHLSINEIVKRGAMDAVTELLAIAEAGDRLYVDVPLTVAGAKKVEAIKTIRVLGNVGLKEAKDMLDAAWPTGCSINHGSTFRIGPFKLGVDLDEANRILAGHVNVVSVASV